MHQETDPTGRALGADGAKMDAGKVAVWSLLFTYFPRALEAVARVSQAGVDKGYAPKSWATVPNGIERYRNAGMRHQLAMAKGELIDNNPGGTCLPHSWQVAWNHLASLELELTEEENEENESLAAFVEGFPGGRP